VRWTEGTGPLRWESLFRQNDYCCPVGAATDAVEVLEERIRRRSRGFFVSVGALTAVAAGLMIWVSTEAPKTASWVPYYVVTVVPGSFILLVWVMRRGEARTIGFVRRLRLRLRDVGVHRGTRLVLVFDNGLVCTLGGSMMWMWLFSTPAGTPASPARVRDAMQMRRGFWRMRAIGIVQPKRGPEDARRELTAIRERVGAKRAMAALYERPTTAPASPVAPAWASAALFAGTPSNVDPSRWAAELDAVRAFLERLRTEHYPPGLHGSHR